VKDQRTQDYIKAWGRKDVPTAVVVDGAVRPGIYPAFVVLGWTASRKKHWPVVILRLALLSKTMAKSVGGLLMSLPFNPKTERHVCSLLQDFGWDGRVWPYKDEGWPAGTPDEDQIIKLLKTENLGATFTFPADPEKGIITLRVPVKKRRGPYAVALFDKVLPKYLETLRELTADPAPFVSDWKT